MTGLSAGCGSTAPPVAQADAPSPTDPRADQEGSAAAVVATEPTPAPPGRPAYRRRSQRGEQPADDTFMSMLSRAFGGGGRVEAADPLDPGCPHSCKGKNDCKGMGMCKVENEHDCKGMNQCKGKGGCKPAC